MPLGPNSTHFSPLLIFRLTLLIVISFFFVFFFQSRDLVEKRQKLRKRILKLSLVICFPKFHIRLFQSRLLTALFIIYKYCLIVVTHLFHSPLFYLADDRVIDHIIAEIIRRMCVSPQIACNFNMLSVPRFIHIADWIKKLYVCTVIVGDLFLSSSSNTESGRYIQLQQKNLQFLPVRMRPRFKLDHSGKFYRPAVIDRIAFSRAASVLYIFT